LARLLTYNRHGALAIDGLQWIDCIAFAFAKGMSWLGVVGDSRMSWPLRKELTVNRVF
jgi:hypothetical protein